MAKKTPETELLDDETLLSLADLARASACELEWVEQLIGHGVIAPVGRGEPVYSAISITRLRKAKRLERDFELNTPALALVLDLLDEIDRLRTRSGSR